MGAAGGSKDIPEQETDTLGVDPVEGIVRTAQDGGALDRDPLPPGPEHDRHVGALPEIDELAGATRGDQADDRLVAHRMREHTGVHDRRLPGPVGPGGEHDDEAVVTTDELTYAIEARHSARLLAMADDDFCYLTTRGRNSGQPHEIEIWYARQGDTLYLMSGGGEHSDWVRNLRAYSAVSVRLNGTTFHATARVLDEGPEERKARDLVFEKYQSRYDGSLRGWRHASLPVAVDLLEPQS